jgi:Rrf2 family protein
MKFSTRTTYGLRAMIRLAQHRGGEPLSLAAISRKEKISLGYLERLFARLRKAGLVKAEKGAGGGYRLARSAGKIIVYDIVKALEGKMSPFYCLDEHGKIYCDGHCRCGATAVLVKVQEAVNKTLKGITLDDLTV